MEARRQDSVGFTGDSSSKITPPPSTNVPSRRDHQTIHYNHPQLNQQHQIFRHNNGSNLLNSDPTYSAATSRSFSRSPPPSSNNPVQYRECLKNHAAGIGGFVLDGCGEFMPMGEEGTLEALKCAVCECHRNFHRKEESAIYPPERRTNQTDLALPVASNSLVQRYQRGSSSSAPMMMSFGGQAESSSEDVSMLASVLQGKVKKRFRTKFSEEQKEMMMEFAETLGWKIQKRDDQQVNEFCSRLGIKRKVFKVWMHNNKQAMKKQHK